MYVYVVLHHYEDGSDDVCAVVRSERQAKQYCACHVGYDGFTVGYVRCYVDAVDWHTVLSAVVFGVGLTLLAFRALGTL